MARIQVTPVGYTLGAAVTGVDLSTTLDEETLRAIKDASTRHLVLVFPGQQLRPEELVKFTENFGQLDNYESQPFNRHPDHDNVMLLSNRRVNGKLPAGANNGQNWHTDLSYTIRPAKQTLVYCIEKPPVGGDTMFASMYAAYDALSPKLQRFLDELEGVHDVSLISPRNDPAIMEAFKRLNPPVIHPAVRLHPDSGRRALYVNVRVRKFFGMTEAESRPLIQYLCDLSVSPRYTYRHRWTVGDLVMWDNRCLTHLAVGDHDPNEIRHMIRTSVLGDYVGRLETPQAQTDAAVALPGHIAAGVSALHD